MSRSSRKEKSKKISKKKIILISIISIFTLIIATGGIYVGYLSSKVDRVEINREDIKDTGLEPAKEEADVINIALFGTDKSGTDNTASDSIMILTINHIKGELKLSSIMRDVTLEVPGRGEENINDVIMIGGPELSIKTLNTNFNLQIDKFVQVNLGNLPIIIDKLGGVEIDVTSEEVQFINSYISGLDNMNGTTTSKITSSGLQNLNGTQASAYCRIRYTEGRDFKRTERQRDVLSALFEKFKDISITEVPGLITEILPLVQTNLTNSEIISISTKALGVQNKTIQQARFPEDEDIITSGFEDNYYRMRIDKETTTEKMHKFIYSLE